MSFTIFPLLCVAFSGNAFSAEAGITYNVDFPPPLATG
jgi:hypothetical protein